MATLEEFRHHFPRTPSSAAGARRFVTDSLSGCAPSLDLDAAVLLANELATNAIRHATGDAFGLVVIVEPGSVRIAVEDEDPTLPKLTKREGPGLGGMGLPLVGALSDSWGVCPGRGAAGGGKRVWFQLMRSSVGPPAVE